MQITRSCYIDCQGAFHKLRSEDLRTFRFFWRSECKLIKNISDIRKIFVSWRAKHEAIYIVNMKKNRTKTQTPQFSLLFSFLSYNIYHFTNCSYIRLPWVPEPQRVKG